MTILRYLQYKIFPNEKLVLSNCNIYTYYLNKKYYINKFYLNLLSLC